MIMYLAALKSVPEELYEAATIDGANAMQKLFFVTLPMMRNIISITVLFSLIVTFADFDIVRILTAGGPQDMTHIFSTYAFEVGILSGDIPLGASVSLFMLPILAIMRLLRPARRDAARQGDRGMSGATAASSAGAVTVRRGRGSSLTGQRRWALWGSYAALAVFVVMFLTPPFYMVMTSLKTSAEISAERGNPWLAHHPTLQNFSELIGQFQLSALLPELGDRDHLRGGHLHGDFHFRGVQPGANWLLGQSVPGYRRLPDVPDPGFAAVHPAIPDRRRARAHQQRLVPGADLSNACGTVLHLDHDRLL